MNAHVSFLIASSTKTSEAREMLCIPRGALIQNEGKSAVFVLEGSRVKLREVQVGRDLGDRMEVAEGLGPNDKVVVKGLEGLTPGQRVRVKAGV
jgi:hypothetical protein